MELVVFSGIQCSGKSSFFEQYFSKSHARINLDSIKSRTKEMVNFISLMEEGYSIVIDNTNPARPDRERYIVPATRSGYRIVGYQFEIPISTALARSAARKTQKTVPVQDIYLTARKMQPLLKTEGFNEIYQVTTDESMSFIIRPI